MTLRITVEDLETGDRGTTTIPLNDYFIVVHGGCYIDAPATRRENDGETHILTIRGRDRNAKAHDKHYYTPEGFETDESGNPIN